MMANKFLYPFTPIPGNTPAFNSTLGSSGVYALESTGTREWLFPTSRTVRVAAKAADDFHVLLGTSTMAPSTATAMACLGGVETVFTVERPGVTHIGIASSTDVVVNVTIGYGY